MMAAQKPTPLAPSELGTKEYWDRLYATELANHAANPADTGTVWFDDADAESKMVRYVEGTLRHELAGLRLRRVLDLGCGNGSLLRALREEMEGAWEEEEGEEEEEEQRAVLLGVDYSAASVSLARETTAKGDEDGQEDGQDSAPPIAFAVWDVLQGTVDELPGAGASWDLVLDKGTFDAISLGHAAAGEGADGASVEETYRRQVLALLRPQGRFLITSCNWTEAELCAWMGGSAGAEAEAEYGLVPVGRVTYPSFQFGGVQGQAVCTVCFAKQQTSGQTGRPERTEAAPARGSYRSR